ncbi:SGNH/GDSL hydrolase family protein [Lentisphaerota bacterium ZTH]|nr:SGNH/GDSL hydrolase family protein [Lentisphaerota bacterium]WET07325.1 SGNH/GDSL hydrolase family protein [Lentisphaerota bacterium ZTH]
MRKSFFVLLCISLPLITFAKAGMNIFIKNESKGAITVDLEKFSSGKVEKSINILPGTTEKLGYISTNRFYGFSKKRRIKIQKPGESCWPYSVDVLLESGYSSNSFRVLKTSGNVAVDNMHKIWQNWFPTPCLTITVSPQKLDISRSRIFQDVIRVLIFGDSLSDKGTLCKYTQGVIPTPRNYYNGMFSNGPVWSEKMRYDLRRYCGIGVSNYAVGGSTTTPKDDYSHLPYSLCGEMETFRKDAANNGWTDFDRFLAFIWIGGNDYLTEPADLTDEQICNLVGNVITGIRNHAEALINTGVKKFVFITLPDLGLVPECKVDLKNSEVTHKLSMFHNYLLKVLVVNLQQMYPERTFALIDMTPKFTECINNPDSFNKKYGTNIVNVDDSCCVGGYTVLDSYLLKTSVLPRTGDLQAAAANYVVVSDRQDEYVFYDRVHPTEPMHNFMYHFYMESLGARFIEEGSPGYRGF